MANEIAKELLSLVSPFNYHNVIPSLNQDDFTPLKMFQCSQLGKLLKIDKSNCMKNGKINNAHLFELFGRYSDEDAESVRSDTLERINTGRNVYEIVGALFFTMRNWSFTDWALTACSNYYYGDELLLYVLCKVFHWHAVVICRSRNWSTLEPEGPMTTEELLDTCDLHLIYLKPGIFGELLPKKSAVFVKQSPPEFPIWYIENTDVSVWTMPNPGKSMDNELLNMYLNIEDSLMEDNTIQCLVQPLTGGNTDTTGIELKQFSDCAYTVPVQNNEMHSVNTLPGLDDGGDSDEHPVITSVKVEDCDPSIVKGRNDGELDSLTGGNIQPNLLFDVPLSSASGDQDEDGSWDNGNITLPLESNTPSSVVTDCQPDDTLWYSDINTLPTSSNANLEISSPVFLRALCIQKLMVHAVILSPMLLWHICIDKLSWNDSRIIASSMDLPRSMCTNNTIFELKKINRLGSQEPPRITRIIWLHNNLTVIKEVHDYWIKELYTRKYKVKIPKLTQIDIEKYINIPVETWKGIDSDSEYVRDTRPEEPIHATDIHLKNPKDSHQSGYLLRAHPERRSNTRPSRMGSQSVKYTDLIYSDLDMQGSPKKHKIKPVVCRGPSASRIAAIGKKCEPPSRTHPIPIYKSRNAETDDSDTEVYASATDTGNYSEDSIMPPLTEDSALVSKHNISTSKKKCVFTTKRVELKRYKRKHSYKCPVCRSKYDTQGDLNSHYWDSHRKVKCKKCALEFTTPSTLTRHYYMHKTPHKICRCGKGFYFNSELKIHKLTHHRIKTQICSHPGCGRSYFSSSDLAKHARIHEKVEWKCTKCEYSTLDRRLLRSHQRVHNRVLRYTCKNCGKGFIYHMQLTRHSKSKNCEPS